MAKKKQDRYLYASEKRAREAARKEERYQKAYEKTRKKRGQNK